MDEFVDRMTTQRDVLNLVNEKCNNTEKLFGLSSSAIERWVLANGLGPSEEVVFLLRQISKDLFFMATRSQEPVSAEYQHRRKEIVDSVAALEKTL